MESAHTITVTIITKPRQPDQEQSDLVAKAAAADKIYQQIVQYLSLIKPNELVDVRIRSSQERTL